MDDAHELDLSSLNCTDDEGAAQFNQTLQSVQDPTLPPYPDTFSGLSIVQQPTIVQPTDHTLEHIFGNNLNPTSGSLQPVPVRDVSYANGSIFEEGLRKSNSFVTVAAKRCPPTHINVQFSASNVTRQLPAVNGDVVTVVPTTPGPAQPNPITLKIEESQFNDKLIWCEECEKGLSTECKDHPPIIVPDRAIPTYAVLTLPSFLSMGTTVIGERTVMAKKAVKKRTRFGPLKGRRTTKCDPDSHCFKVYKSKVEFEYLELVDESICNWLMFVRPASSFSDQNLVVYQHNQQMHFVVSKFIQPGQELRYGFSTSYAELLDVHTFKEMMACKAAKPESTIIFKDSFPCELCTIEFDCFENLDEHKCAADSKVQENKRTKNKRKGKPRKLATSKTGPVKKTQTTSIHNRKKPTPSCAFCGLNFPNKSKLEIHVYKHTGYMPHRCEKTGCNKSFDTRFKLLRHALIHGTKNFECDHCRKSFSRKDHLKNHYVTHDDNRAVYLCEYLSCNKKYTTMQAFKAHIAYHRAELGSLQCSICNRLFDGKEPLMKHIKVHAGSRIFMDDSEKKHGCEICSKRFYTQKDLKRHFVTHSRERNFDCESCGHKFGRLDHLTRHIRNNHEGIHMSQKKKSATVTEDQRYNLELSKSIEQILESNVEMEPPTLAVGSQVVTSLSPSSVQITSVQPTNLCVGTGRSNPIEFQPVFPGSLYPKVVPMSSLSTSQIFNSSSSSMVTQASTHNSKPKEQLSQTSNFAGWHPITIFEGGQRIVISNSESRLGSSNQTMILVPELLSSLNMNAQEPVNQNKANNTNVLLSDIVNDENSTELSESMKYLGNLGSISNLLNNAASSDADLTSIYTQPNFTQNSSVYR